MESFTFDWMQLFFGVLGVIITVVVVPWIQANTTEKQRELAFKIIKELVAAAEQLFNSGQIADRKAYALHQAGGNRKLDVLEEYEVKQLIEAAVYRLNQDREHKTKPQQEGESMDDTGTM